jgi:preprotein translocase subunit SecF
MSVQRFTGFEIFRRQTRIDFLKYRKLAGVVSVVLLLGSLALLFPQVRGLNLSIDFTGGVVLELGYPAAADLPAVRETLAAGGYPDAQVQNFGTARDVIVRVLPREGRQNQQVSDDILRLLQKATPDVERRRTESVGPQVGEELANQGALALLLALFLIGLYIAVRFQWKFSVGAMIATIHDPLITAGIFALFRIPFDLAVLAALLAIIGYSVNDTVVVFDRIRDNFRKIRRGTPEEIMNLSINETLSRTLMTSFVTALVVIAMLLFGGESLRGFSLALIIGIVVGTYSSIFVASAVALWLGASPTDLLPPKEEKDAIDALP